MAVLTAVLLGCGLPSADPEATDTEPAPAASATPTPTATVEVSASPTPTPTPEPYSDGRPQDATLSLPSLGIEELQVQAYEGFTDDAPGTVIQDGGIAASPYGTLGGVGPGGIGNYQVTAHRTSSTRAFFDLPDLAVGERIDVIADGIRYIYEITDTRITSFRSEQSLAEQRAAVPGQPGAEADRAYITLSTCRTPEDRAEGNFWSDEFGNPENRIDKIGILVASEPA